MATENLEMEEINRLLEVEKKATVLVTDALNEADKRLAEARATFNEQVKIKTEIHTEKLSAEYNSKINELKEKHNKEIEDFKKSLEQKEMNQADLNLLLDKYLFAAE